MRSVRAEKQQGCVSTVSSIASDHTTKLHRNAEQGACDIKVIGRVRGQLLEQVLPSTATQGLCVPVPNHLFLAYTTWTAASGQASYIHAATHQERDTG